MKLTLLQTRGGLETHGGRQHWIEQRGQRIVIAVKGPKRIQARNERVKRFEVYPSQSMFYPKLTS